MLFAVRGVITTPALAIDGNIVLSGSVPSQDRLQKLLQEHGFSARQPDSQDSGCCSSSNENSSSCCNSTTEPKQSCCSGSAGKPASVKRIVTTALIAFMVLAGIRLYNKQQNAQNSRQADAAVPADTRQAAQGKMQVIFYMIGAKCSTCTNMHNWIEACLKEHYSELSRQNMLEFVARDASEEEMQQYALVSKSVVIKIQDAKGQQKQVVLNKLFDHRGDREAFVAYLRGGLDQAAAMLQTPVAATARPVQAAQGACASGCSAGCN